MSPSRATVLRNLLAHSTTENAWLVSPSIDAGIRNGDIYTRPYGEKGSTEPDTPRVSESTACKTGFCLLLQLNTVRDTNGKL